MRQHFYNILKKDGVTENPNNNTPHSDQDSAIDELNNNNDNDYFMLVIPVLIYFKTFLTSSSLSITPLIIIIYLATVYKKKLNIKIKI